LVFIDLYELKRFDLTMMLLQRIVGPEYGIVEAHSIVIVGIFTSFAHSPDRQHCFGSTKTAAEEVYSARVFSNSRPACRRMSLSEKALQSVASNDQLTAIAYDQVLALKQRQILGYPRP
jgi:hypothetical protein